MNIALIVDRPDWAYFNIAFQVKKISESYKFCNVEIFSIDSKCSWQDVVDVMSSEFDHIHFFWRKHRQAGKWPKKHACVNILR